MRKRYADGIAWGEMKQALFEYINDHVGPARREYERLIANPDYVEQVLARGAERARAVSRPFLDQIRYAVGVRSLSGARSGSRARA